MTARPRISIEAAPPKEEKRNVGLWLSTDLVAALDDVAKAKNRSRSEVVALVLREALFPAAKKAA